MRPTKTPVKEHPSLSKPVRHKRQPARHRHPQQLHQLQTFRLIKHKKQNRVRGVVLRTAAQQKSSKTKLIDAELVRRLDLHRRVAQNLLPVPRPEVRREDPDGGLPWAEGE